MAMKYLDLALTESVRRAQQQYYGHAATIANSPERDPLGEAEMEFITARDSFYLGTVSESGWPYLQHRGGPQGFCESSTKRLWRSPITKEIDNCLQPATSP